MPDCSETAHTGRTRASSHGTNGDANATRICAARATSFYWLDAELRAQLACC